MVPAQQLVRPYPSAAAAQAVKPVRPAPGNPFYVEHKGKRSSFRPVRPLQALFFFVPDAARFFFSRGEKEMWGVNAPPLAKRAPPLGRADDRVYFFPKEVFTRSLAA